MDGERFDAWTRALAGSGSRRGALRRLAGGVLGLALVGRGARGGSAQEVGIAACTPVGVRCGPNTPRACHTCCTDGQDCRRHDQCCTGVCERGVCGAGFVCDPRSEPENCRRGVENSCAGGACACVEDVDGGNACVERDCTGTPCARGADCGNRPCVRIPGCCGVNPFCGVPCGAGPRGGDGARSAGWR